MAKKSSLRNQGTSFHGHEIVCTPKDLKQILGEPTYEQNYGKDKVNLEWVCETEDGEVFTIYDWKEYRTISEDEDIQWHLGGHSANVTSKAFFELLRQLEESLGG